MLRRRPRKNLSYKKLAILLLITILFFLIIFIMTSKSGFMKISSVETSLSGVNCVNEADLKDSANLMRKNVYVINFNKTSENLKNKFYCIKKIDISYLFPNKVKLTVFGREPAAILLPFENEQASASAILDNMATPSAGQTAEKYLMDEEGMVFSKELPSVDIPSIFLVNINLSLGKKIEANSENILKIFDKVETFGLDIKNTVLMDNLLIIFSDPKIVFKLEEEIDRQLASLQLILSEAKINSRKLEFIDLRFDKPIVRFAPKKNG